MGFKVVDERTYKIEPGDAGAAEVWLHDMMLERADGAAFDIDALKARLEASFMAVMRGRAENDGYNALVLTAGAQWRDVALVRTISRFLRQVRVPYSQDYMWATLRRHSGVAAQIVAAVPSALRSEARSHEGRARREADRAARRDRDRARRGRKPRRGPHPAPLRQCGDVGAAHQFLSARRRRPAEGRRSRSSSTAARSTACRCPSRSTRSSSIRRASRAIICASARSRAAASAGPTGRRISAPRCSASSRRSR